MLNLEIQIEFNLKKPLINSVEPLLARGSGNSKVRLIPFVFLCHEMRIHRNGSCHDYVEKHSICSTRVSSGEQFKIMYLAADCCFRVRIFA